MAPNSNTRSSATARGRTFDTVGYDEGLSAFMRGAMGYMCLGLLLTAGIAALLATNPPAVFFTFTHVIKDGHSQLEVSHGLLYWIALVASFVLIFPMAGDGYQGRSGKGAAVMFFLFSALFGVILTPLFVKYTGVSLARAGFITAIAFGGSAIVGYTMKLNLTGYGNAVLVGLLGLIAITVINRLAGAPISEYVIDVIGVLLFVGITMYDMQKLRERYQQRDAVSSHGLMIMGALDLYLDVVNLFVRILQLTGSSDD